MKGPDDHRMKHMNESEGTMMKRNQEETTSPRRRQLLIQEVKHLLTLFVLHFQSLWFLLLSAGSRPLSAPPSSPRPISSLRAPLSWSEPPELVQCWFPLLLVSGVANMKLLVQVGSFTVTSRVVGVQPANRM